MNTQTQNAAATTFTRLVDHQSLALAILCSPFAGRVVRGGMSEDDEVLAAMEAIGTALDSDGVLSVATPFLMEEVHAAMALTPEGVAYDPAKVAVLEDALVKLCGGDFDEDGPTARLYGLEDLGCAAEETIAGTLFAVTCAVASHDRGTHSRQAA